jgi:endonuclease YncB( thermonuclease family)
MGAEAKFAMVALCKGQIVHAIVKDEMSYDRVVAKCYLPDGRDIAAELVKLGLALDWPKFSGGVYKQFEPHGIRKKLWRAAARQQGRYREGM